MNLRNIRAMRDFASRRLEESASQKQIVIIYISLALGLTACSNTAATTTTTTAAAEETTAAAEETTAAAEEETTAAAEETTAAAEESAPATWENLSWEKDTSPSLSLCT